MVVAQSTAVVLLALFSSAVPIIADYMPAVAVMIAGGLYLTLTMAHQVMGYWGRFKKAVGRWVGWGGRGVRRD
jgi:hypothetical protein